MSSLKGEQALKDGLSFEFTWTARHLIEVLEERAECIWLGGMAHENGADFRLCFPDHEEHHQVKRAFGTADGWTIASLDSEGVLQDFKRRLDDPRVHCHFVSTLPAVPLGYLAKRSRASNDFEVFQQSYLNGDYKKWFSEVAHRWNLSGMECWQRLKRIETHHPDEQDLIRLSIFVLRAMVIGDPQSAWTHLRDYCFDNLHQQRRSAEVWQWLHTKGIHRQPVQGDTRVLALLKDQTERYLGGVRRKLIQPPLIRSVTETVVAEMTDAETGQDIVILGEPGGGKSAVMLQVAEACISKGWPVLAFRLDELSANLTVAELRAALDLPISPARAVALAASGGPALVIIDQLDAVSLYSGRTGSLFNRVAELVEEVRGYRLRSPIHMMIACRSVDWRHDGRFRSFQRRPVDGERSSADDGVHKVEALTDEEIARILNACGLGAASFTPRQRDQLLRHPQYLAILVEARPSLEAIRHIVTPKHLFDAYWTRKERDLSEKYPHAPVNQWREILRSITSKLAETALALAPSQTATADNAEAPLAVPKRLIENYPRTVVDWMVTNGVLVEAGNRIRFAHESFFDYCFARFFDETGETMLAYLLRSDQTLIQRGQLRQVLAYQRDEDIAKYYSTAKELMDKDGIRPHLKQLLACVLCEVTNPSEADFKFIQPYLDKALVQLERSNDCTVDNEVFGAFSKSLPLFRIACATGAFAGWLQNSGSKGVERLTHLMFKHQEWAQSEVWQLISPLRGHERFLSHLAWLSHHCQASKSRETFDWLVSEMRRGIEEDASHESESEWGRFYLLSEDLAAHKPAWLAEWVAANIRARATQNENIRYELLRDNAVAPSTLKTASAAEPMEFVRHVLPVVIDVLESKRIFDTWGCFEYRTGDEARYVSTEENLFDALIDALRALFTVDQLNAIHWMERLRTSVSRTCRRLHAATLCGDIAGLAPLAASCIVDSQSSVLEIDYGGGPAVCEIVSVHCRRFSHAQLAAIEQVFLAHFPDYERQHSQNAMQREGPICLGNRRGYRQMLLLRSIPEDLISNGCRLRLAEWERKFDSVRRLCVKRDADRPINTAAIISRPPEEFLKAIEARKRRNQHAWEVRDYDAEGKITAVMPQAIKERAGTFSEYLKRCDESTDKSFVRTVARSIAEIEPLSPSLAIDTMINMHNLGEAWGYEVVLLLRRIPLTHFTPDIREVLLDYATSFPPPDLEEHKSERDDPCKRLHTMATWSVRGRAMEILRLLIWNDPALVPALKDRIEGMMREPNAALRAEAASICYATAFTASHRSAALEWFLTLVSDDLPDRYILGSYWPFQFMRAGLDVYWSSFMPIIRSMIESQLPELRSAGARLACMAVFVEADAIELAERCVSSPDVKVRTSCAAVLVHNLGVKVGGLWASGAFLRLADDAEIEVCRAIGRGFRRDRPVDFGALADVLGAYVNTRAFVVAPSGLLDSLSESRTVLPATVLKIIEVFIRRICDPGDGNNDRPSFHVNSVSAILTRLYHENRDTELRRRILDLIDLLCGHDILDVDRLDR